MKLVYCVTKNLNVHNTVRYSLVSIYQICCKFPSTYLTQLLIKAKILQAFIRVCKLFYIMQDFVEGRQKQKSGGISPPEFAVIEEELVAE